MRLRPARPTRTNSPIDLQVVMTRHDAGLAATTTSDRQQPRTPLRRIRLTRQDGDRGLGGRRFGRIPDHHPSTWGATTFLGVSSNCLRGCPARPIPNLRHARRPVVAATWASGSPGCASTSCCIHALCLFEVQHATSCADGSSRFRGSENQHVPGWLLDGEFSVAQPKD